MFRLRDIKLHGILAGLAVDIGGTTLSGMGVGLGIALISLIQRLPMLDIEKLYKEPAMEAAAMACGLVYTFGGACVASIIGKPSCRLNATLFGIVTTLSGLCFLEDSPLWYIILGLTLTPVVAVLGGVFIKRYYH